MEEEEEAASSLCGEERRVEREGGRVGSGRCSGCGFRMVAVNGLPG